MSTPTPTPRTDEAALYFDDGYGEMSPIIRADFARTLERELAAAHAEVRNKHDIAQELLARAMKAEAELAGSKRRCERLEKTQAICRCGDPLLSHNGMDGCSGVEMRQECPFEQELCEARAQLARKDEALRPFAAIGLIALIKDGFTWHPPITYGDIRRAVRALHSKAESELAEREQARRDGIAFIERLEARVRELEVERADYRNKACNLADQRDSLMSKLTRKDEALRKIATYDTGPLGRTDADANRWRGMAAAALAQETPTLVLNKEDSAAFVDALMNPRPPDERMKRAMARHKELVQDVSPPEQKIDTPEGCVDQKESRPVCVYCGEVIKETDDIFRHSAFCAPAYGRTGVVSHAACHRSHQDAITSSPRQG